MNEIKFWLEPTLPGTITAAHDGIWFVKPNGAQSKMHIYIIYGGKKTDLDAVDAAALLVALATKADDNTVVHIAGSETITGKKTFTTVPASDNDATQNNELVRKGQMDSALGDKADDSAVVHKAGTETIT